MEGHTDLYVSQIRSFNRFYTKLLGLLNRHILDSPYSLTEVRILLEIERVNACTANKLIDKLEVDRGYMSRVLKSFESSGLIQKKGTAADRRKLLLELTEKGKDTLAELEGRSSRQVESLIEHLDEKERQVLIQSMASIKSSLLRSINPVTIRSYRKEDLGYIIGRHRALYASEYGFSSEFSDYVEKYVLKFDEHHDPDKENIWIGEADGKPVGMIALVRIDDVTAQLRWFLIEPEMRGMGLGHMLMDTVMNFCKEKGYTHVFLWTVNILEAARALYSRFGFQLTESKANYTWNGNLLEERWDLYM